MKTPMTMLIRAQAKRFVEALETQSTPALAASLIQARREGAWQTEGHIRALLLNRPLEDVVSALRRVEGAP